ncbi:hypothetical protein F4810DRAFT_449492 [Camillea tinctor]|nr:hypothetical protein F4810DRAFT_449492 [Camillea tinctor]
MSNTAPTHEEWDPKTYWVAPARNFRFSARLHLQHTLFQSTLGHLLAPQIQAAVADSAHLKVADLGCGNGVWLSDLDRELSSRGITAQLNGYDLNAANFPAAPFRPASMTLKTLDVLASSLPAEHLGAYDIVHARVFVSSIPNSDPTAFLSAARALLKPGGWLQWEESRADRHVVEAPPPDVGKSACETITGILKAGAEARGFRFEALLDGLGDHLERGGFGDVRVGARDTCMRDWKAWTENYLMVWEELASAFPPREVAPQAPMSREQWVQLFAGAVKEAEDGVVVHQGSITYVVGRKALG